MKTFLTLSLAFAIHSFGTAQNIPDANFAQAIRDNCPACIDANNNLTQAADTLEFLNVWSRGIRDLSGIQGFDSLVYVYADGNQIQTVPALANTIEMLSLSDNPLSSLNNISNLSNLKYLYLASCSLYTLPILPPNLLYLSVNYNRLSNLPNLPNQLTQLEAHSNQLSQLPPLPNSLITLAIGYNNFQSCPTNLPNSLKLLNLYGNALDSFYIDSTTQIEYLNIGNCGLYNVVNLPPNLRGLDMYDNYFTILPTFPDSIRRVFAFRNNIHSVSQIELLNNLDTFIISFNDINALPNLPPNLSYLAVGNNNLTTLPTLPNSLRYLDFQYNNIDVMPNLNDSITELVVNNNLLSEINYLPSQLVYLDISNNIEIICLPYIDYTLSYLNHSNTSINCLSFDNSFSNSRFNLPLCDWTNNTNNCLMVSVNNTPAPTFMVSPNPFHNYLTVQNSDLLDDNSQLYLYNNLGQLVKQQQLLSNNENIDVSDLQPAVYYLTIKTSKGSFSQKVVKN